MASRLGSCIVLFRYFAADILENREEHFVGRGTGGTRTFHDHIFVVLHLDRHFEFTRLADKLGAIFGKFEIAVGVYIFGDHTDEQRLTQDRVEGRFLFVARRAEVL